MNKPAKKKGTVPKIVPKESLISNGPFHFHGNNFHLGLIIAIIAFCFTIYGNGISNGFSLDDEFVLHGDTVVSKGFSGVPKLFKLRYAWDQKGSYGYRPLAKVSFAIETQLFGSSPHVGHVINILLYAFLCIFLFYFFRKILYEWVSDYLLLIFIAIFIAHPMHTEVVDSLKNREIILLVIFGFYCTYAFVKGFETDNMVQRVLWIVSGLIAYDLGWLCKTDEVVFIAITPLVLIFYEKGKFKSAIISVIAILLAGMFLSRVIHHVLPHSDYHRTFIYIEEPLLHTHAWQRLSLGFYSLWFYVRKLIFPVDMVCYYGYATIEPHPAWTNPSVLIGLVLAGVFFYLVYKNRKDRGVVLLTLLLSAGSMFLYLNVIQVGPGIEADRFSFIPSIGFTLSMVLLLFYLFKVSFKNKLYGVKAQYIYMVSGLVVLIYSGRTIARNPNWESHFSIYEHDAKLAPKSSKLQALLAAAYIQKIQENPGLPQDERGNYYQLAYQAYQASVDVYPEYATSLNNLGMIQYSYFKNLKAALEFFDKAIQADSNYAEAYFNKGAAEESLGNNQAAEDNYLKAIKANPDYFMTYSYLSKLYFDEGKLYRIIQVNQDAIDNGHVSDMVYINVGNASLALQDTAKAVSYFEKGLSLSYRNLNVARFLLHYYTDKKNLRKVEYYNQIVGAMQGQNQGMHQ